MVRNGHVFYRDFPTDPKSNPWNKIPKSMGVGRCTPVSDLFLRVRKTWIFTEIKTVVPTGGNEISTRFPT